jgi:DNA-binding CsgD family transcriptional regulator
MVNTRVKEAVLIIVFTIVAVASGVDLMADLAHGSDIEHIIKEAIIVSMSMIAIAWLMWGLHQQQLEIRSLQQELETASSPQTPPKKYVLEARKNLGNVITQQFSEWLLTDSEKAIGWLLLKGLSLKEIAIVRNTQEKTVRQQASAIYKKAGVTGRHVFSAWFIEDIL